ncbi:MAG TPA: LCP family protein [Pseudolysinimonas sp.]|nr:LCP family protein [Pseudolysinimonas sp.]
MTSTNAIRSPDTRSPELMTKRAWWLVGLNILVPGSAQTLAGNRRLGRFALGATLILWVLIVICLASILIGRSKLLPLVLQPIPLWAVAVVLGFYGVLWVICTLDTLRLTRLVRVPGARRAAVALLAVVGLVVCSGVAFGGAYVSARAAHVLGEVASNTIAITNPDGSTVQVGPLTGSANLLLVGDDSGGGDAKYGPRGETLNDVTILIHISPASNSATAISIPRDLYVGQPGCDGKPAVTQARFNTALSRGGLDCVVAATTALTGLPIQYAAEIEFDGVVAMSDAVGGVPVCLVTAIDDPASGLQLSAGEHTLQGAQALAFLRTRHGLTTGSDLQRISNQQIFLASLMRTVKSPATLGNPQRVLDLAEAAAQHMTLSTDLAKVSTMVSIALAVRDIPLDRIAFVQYPSHPTTVRGQSVTLPDTDAAKALTDAVAADRPVVTQVLGGAAVASGSPPPATPSPTPSPSSSQAPPVPLPSEVTGQSAAQQTCSQGQHG